MRVNLRASIELLFGTQQNFARSIGCHPVRLNRLCCGWVEPTSEERSAIADHLLADPSWLFTEFRIPARNL
jgi:hypothetical protein